METNIKKEFDFNRNEKQLNFNQIKGTLSEINEGTTFCNITIKSGHENIREINLVIKKDNFDKICSDKKIGDKVAIRFYLSSRRRKEGGWYTMANVLTIEKL